MGHDALFSHKMERDQSTTLRHGQSDNVFYCVIDWLRDAVYAKTLEIVWGSVYVSYTTPDLRAVYLWFASACHDLATYRTCLNMLMTRPCWCLSIQTVISMLSLVMSKHGHYM